MALELIEEKQYFTFRTFYQGLDDEWFNHIREKRKIVEGRLNKSWVKELKKDDVIEFQKKSDVNDTIVVKVTDVKKYKNFIALFEDVGLDKVLPNINGHLAGVKVYRQWYSKELEDELGVVGIFFNLI